MTMYQITDENEHQFVIAVDGHAVATIQRHGKSDEQWRRLVAIIRNAPALLDSIDQCAASLENCAGHYGDSISRRAKANAKAAREAQARAEGFGNWDEALAASATEEDEASTTQPSSANRIVCYDEGEGEWTIELQDASGDPVRDEHGNYFAIWHNEENDCEPITRAQAVALAVGLRNEIGMPHLRVYVMHESLVDPAA
jgi:hypothetical protein